MASTRNINTPGNYCLQQRQFLLSKDYTLYPNSQYGYAYHTQMPGNGFNPAQIPGDKLSYNSTNIESFLFGINSTNLVNPAPCFKPELKELTTANIYKSQPTIMPIPFVMEQNQRPFPIPD
jgi:hypothetical protein